MSFVHIINNIIVLENDQVQAVRNRVTVKTKVRLQARNRTPIPMMKSLILIPGMSPSLVKTLIQDLIPRTVTLIPKPPVPLPVPHHDIHFNSM